MQDDSLQIKNEFDTTMLHFNHLSTARSLQLYTYLKVLGVVVFLFSLCFMVIQIILYTDVLKHGISQEELVQVQVIEVVS